MKKIVWAVDPFEETNEMNSHVVAALAALAKEGAEIEAVYVLSPDEYQLPLDWHSLWSKELHGAAVQALNAFLKHTALPHLLPPRVLVQRTPSLAHRIAALLAHAKRVGADLIAVGTHARHGLPRIFLGSFAESLLLKSPIPCLIVGPRSHAAKIQKILFATDFGKRSLALFKKVLLLAKSQQAGITLFHSVSQPFEPAIQSGVYLLGGGPVFLPDFSKSQAERRRLSEKYAGLARRQGIPIGVQFDSAHGSIVQSILQCAQSEKADLIAMAAESGPFAAAVVGSVTRQVVRSAPCPVWVLRAQQP